LILLGVTDRREEIIFIRDSQLSEEFSQFPSQVNNY
jgi:transcriptional regulator CtsR